MATTLLQINKFSESAYVKNWSVVIYGHSAKEKKEKRKKKKNKKTEFGHTGSDAFVELSGSA